MQTQSSAPDGLGLGKIGIATAAAASGPYSSIGTVAVRDGGLRLVQAQQTPEEEAADALADAPDTNKKKKKAVKAPPPSPKPKPKESEDPVRGLDLQTR